MALFGAGILFGWFLQGGRLLVMWLGVSLLTAGGFCGWRPPRIQPQNVLQALDAVQPALAKFYDS